MLLLACSRPMAVADAPDSGEPPSLEWEADTGPTTAWVTFHNATNSHVWQVLASDVLGYIEGAGFDPGESMSTELDPDVWTFVLHDDAENCWAASAVTVHAGDTLDYTVSALPGLLDDDLFCAGGV